MATSTIKFLYEWIWCRFGCPIEIVNNQGTHFVNKVIHELSNYYAVVHKRTFRVQVTERLDEEQSEWIRNEQLLLLEESRLQAMCHLEQK